MKKCYFCLKKCLHTLFSLTVAFLLLEFHMNFKKLDHFVKTATLGMDHAIQQNKEESSKSFIELCRSELISHNRVYREQRQPFLNEPKNYSDVIEKEMTTRIKLILGCIEKMYTFSRNPRQISFERLRHLLSKVLNSFEFDEQYNKAKDPRSADALSFLDVKAALKYLTIFVESAEFDKMKKKTAHEHVDKRRFLNRTFVMDSVEKKFGFSGQQVLYSEHISNVPQLQTMHKKILASLK